MPTTRAADSSPIAIPPVPRPLKRSASTASLPTPPRTSKKTTRARSRGSVFDSDSDASDYERAAPVGGAGGALFVGAKRRRTGLDALASAIAGSQSADPADAAEDAFWMGDGGRSQQGSERGTILQSPPDLAPAPHPKAAAPSATRGRAPMSPPPSRRRTQTVKRTLPLVAPVTPPRRSTRVVSKGKAKVPGPVRDSPNNPFLVNDDSPASVEASPAGPRTPSPHKEKPTLTYVLWVPFTCFPPHVPPDRSVLQPRRQDHVREPAVPD